MTRIMLASAILAFGCGCAQRQARHTALVLREQLDNYRKAVSAARQAETDFYKESAAIAEQSQRNLSENATVDARRTNSFRFADMLAADPAQHVTTSALMDFLTSSTDAEFDLAKQAVQRRAQARADFLKGVQDLAALSRDIDVVEAELQALSQDRQPMEAARDVTSLLQDTAAQVRRKLEERKK
jgi:hypothetical protein